MMVKKTDIFAQSVKTVSENKLALSGIAILLVVLYHSGSIIFYPGFMGVDIFMFLSGYFLCYSYERHKLNEFYKRRFLRIYPLFLLLAIFVSIKAIISCGKIDLWNVFCNITTLSYYGVGGSFVDWYLSSLFVFYVFFPVVYKVSKYKYSYTIPILTFTVLMATFAFVDMDWRFECALGRIPIFIMGTVAYHEKEKSNNGFGVGIFTIASLLLLIPSFFLYRQGFNIHTFFLLYLLGPFLIIVLGYTLQAIDRLKTNRNLQWLGKHSLELYVANVIAMSIVFNANLPLLLHFVLYITTTIVISSLTIVFDKQCQNRTKCI